MKYEKCTRHSLEFEKIIRMWTVYALRSIFKSRSRERERERMRWWENGWARMLNEGQGELVIVAEGKERKHFAWKYKICFLFYICPLSVRLSLNWYYSVVDCRLHLQKPMSVRFGRTTVCRSVQVVCCVLYLQWWAAWEFAVCIRHSVSECLPYLRQLIFFRFSFPFFSWAHADPSHPRPFSLSLPLDLSCFSMHVDFQPTVTSTVDVNCDEIHTLCRIFTSALLFGINETLSRHTLRGPWDFCYSRFPWRQRFIRILSLDVCCSSSA